MVEPKNTKKLQRLPATTPTLKHRSKSITVIVKEVIDFTDTIYFLRLTPDVKPFKFQPGQFISLMVEKEGKIISRPYSIASPPEHKDYIELCIRKVPDGFMSNYLSNLPVGTRLKARGPLGRFVLPEPITCDTVFVGTGTGIAPLISMVGHIFREGSDVNSNLEFWLIIGMRYVKEMIYKEFLENISREHPNFHVIYTLSRPETPDWKGRVGYVQKVITEEIVNPQDKYVYICGLRHMIEETKALCEKLGFAYVSFEKWD